LLAGDKPLKGVIPKLAIMASFMEESVVDPLHERIGER
jgi:hypothetical protein